MMPAMTMLGWFHTIMGVLALLLATAAIRNHGFIRSTDREGGAYLVVTVVVAGSALGIYNQSGFGVAHYLAVLTLAAAFGGFVIQQLNLFGRFSVYFQAIAYSATILFHMIPAIWQIGVGSDRSFYRLARFSRTSGVSSRVLGTLRAGRCGSDSKVTTQGGGFISR